VILAMTILMDPLEIGKFEMTSSSSSPGETLENKMMALLRMFTTRWPTCLSPGVFMRLALMILCHTWQNFNI